MKKPTGSRVFEITNDILLIVLALLCVLPFLHVAAISLSSAPAATAGEVGLWPVGFTLDSYKYALQRTEFVVSIYNTIQRVLLGVSINMLLLVLTAYPLSKSSQVLPGRTLFAWFFVITMLIGGGLIPTYLVVSWTGIRNTIWSLVLPGAVNAFNLTILLNFFRQIPKELEESAVLDGASQLAILAAVFLPLSVPALATLTIFNTVGHWNEWFSGLIYMDSVRNYPLQSYLQTVIVEINFDIMTLDQIEMMTRVTNRTFKAAQIMIATLPIIFIYPFLQRHFVKGMTLGSLKG